MKNNKLVNTFESKEYETCYQEFYNRFFTKRNLHMDDKEARDLFLAKGGLNYRLEGVRTDVELFICSIIDNLIPESEESEGLAITDKEKDKFYCFLKEDLSFKEVETNEGIELHIRDSEKEVTIKLSNNTKIESITHPMSADIFELDDNILLGYL